jgi:mannosylglycerate hydrolase
MKMNPVAFSVPYEYSLFSQQEGETVLSTVKRSEDNRGVVIRFFNPTVQKTMASFQWHGSLSTVWRTNLNETPLAPLSMDAQQRFTVQVKPNEVQTVLVVDQEGNGE